MPLLVSGVFGLIVGSFLNVVILRFNEAGIGGRSACTSCKRRLHAADLVPVLSWIFLRGRCRYCQHSISIQYPLVESATAIFFIGIVGARLPLIPTTLAFVILSLLICLFVYDLQHKLLPDVWVWPFCALSLVFGVFSANYQLPAASLLLAGPMAALPILFLWALSSPFTGYSGAWMGFGDVKLALGIGWLLGFPLGLVAVFFAFIIGAVVSVCILLPLPHYVRLWHTVLGHAHAAKAAFFRPVEEIGTGSNVDDQTLPTMASTLDHAAFAAGYTMKSEVPFGPFLIVSCVLVWFMALYNVSIPLLLI